MLWKRKAEIRKCSESLSESWGERVPQIFTRGEKVSGLRWKSDRLLAESGDLGCHVFNQDYGALERMLDRGAFEEIPRNPREQLVFKKSRISSNFHFEIQPDTAKRASCSSFIETASKSTLLTTWAGETKRKLLIVVKHKLPSMEKVSCHDDKQAPLNGWGWKWKSLWHSALQLHSFFAAAWFPLNSPKVKVNRCRTALTPVEKGSVLYRRQ